MNSNERSAGLNAGLSGLPAADPGLPGLGPQVTGLAADPRPGEPNDEAAVLAMMERETPLARLEASRERLRAAMMPPPEPASSRHDGQRSMAWDWIDKLAGIPTVAVIVDAIGSWWSRHPLHTVSLVAREAATTVATPLARQNPLALAAGALIFGALFVRLRAWRWLLRPALLAGLMPQVASRIVAHLPIESWLSVLNNLLTPRPPPRHERASTRSSARAATPPHGAQPQTGARVDAGPAATPQNERWQAAAGDARMNPRTDPLADPRPDPRNDARAFVRGDSVETVP